MTIVDRVKELDIRTVFTNRRLCAFGIERFCVMYVGYNNSIIRDMLTDEIVSPESFEGSPEDIVILLDPDDLREHLLARNIRLPKGEAERARAFHARIDSARENIRRTL